ncbi:beta-glucosidase-like glycosyl hydrolase [Thioflavicoccus mobilis 8321]|uniref:Beta-hexosaminidase n=1 Tax=Thioflavicoccus mobilis 8321 TaxID=765912 RepID=L0GZL9_9GAMM|nr:beta-N-acetylhexosaminidase [Thioflavicoccus mobilis]AGA90825.1 beta-glucosidase-like glycosyl hydrolase [Thioflavicoccus mobilis 8321]
MSLGPVMLDLDGPELSPEERELLGHPAVGGVILFSRNFVEPAQIAALTSAIHAVREPHLLIGVDQEGGRVQRFREGFTRLPPVGRIGALFRDHPARGLRAAERLGWLMAAELRAVGVDFSFAPVLDLDRGISHVIGDRAFGDSQTAVTELATAWMRGVHAAGMAAVGKHFPGHGGVAADSHAELPRDERPLEALRHADLIPFERLIGHGLEAIMPAHVVYPRIDPQPAGFSSFWLRTLLRRELDFQGIIFSDDLTMQGAAGVGDHRARADLALSAGCDMILVCNDRAAALETIDGRGPHEDPTICLRLLRMHGRQALDNTALHQDPRREEALHSLAELDRYALPSLDLEDPTSHGKQNETD